jgi:uncharacterized protein YnzC (UPF0291/DUF896 family)
MRWQKSKEEGMEQEKIDRINVLARKSKAEGLTEAEKKEQELLRQEYIATIRRNLRAQLDNIDVVNPDGTTENLGEKYGRKEAN